MILGTLDAWSLSHLSSEPATQRILLKIAGFLVP